MTKRWRISGVAEGLLATFHEGHCSVEALRVLCVYIIKNIFQHHMV